MKRRPSVFLLVSLGVLLALGGAGGWAWSKVNSVPTEVRKKLCFIGSLKYQERKPATAEETAAMRKQVAELKRKMLAEFPDLAITELPVPDDQNGFRQMYEFVGNAEHKDLPITRELFAQLDYSAPWDPAAMRAALEANREFVSHIERIASLPQRSSANMPEDYIGFISARPAKSSAEILMAKARLAAEAKDEAEALRLATITLNLASHYDQIETPTLLGATVGILINLQVCNDITTKLLPALGRDADLPRWQAVIHTRPDYTPEAFANILRGEWHAMMNHIMAVGLLDYDFRTSPKEVEAVVRTLAFQYDFRIRSLLGQKSAALLSLPEPPSPPAELTAEGREVVGTLWIGVGAWGKGYARAASVRAQTLAALDLLVLEKSGTILTADAASQVTLDPLTGHVFLFDPATRTLTIPSDISRDVDVKPVTLPW